jgi:hypothetical protein
MLEKINWSLIWGIIGGIVFIGSAIGQWVEKKEQENIAKESTAKFESANQEIKKLQRELINQITGGEKLSYTKDKYIS